MTSTDYPAPYYVYMLPLQSSQPHTSYSQFDIYRDDKILPVWLMGPSLLDVFARWLNLQSHAGRGE